MENENTNIIETRFKNGRKEYYKNNTSYDWTALEEIRPFLLSDGGDITLLSINKNIVKVQLLGNCVTCSRVNHQIIALIF